MLRMLLYYYIGFADSTALVYNPTCWYDWFTKPCPCSRWVREYNIHLRRSVVLGDEYLMAKRTFFKYSDYHIFIDEVHEIIL